MAYWLKSCDLWKSLNYVLVYIIFKFYVPYEWVPFNLNSIPKQGVDRCSQLIITTNEIKSKVFDERNFWRDLRKFIIIEHSSGFGSSRNLIQTKGCVLHENIHSVIHFKDKSF